jgi:hypothetical protein
MTHSDDLSQWRSVTNVESVLLTVSVGMVILETSQGILGSENFFFYLPPKTCLPVCVSWILFCLGLLYSLQRRKRGIRGEEGIRCRCYERQRDKGWGDSNMVLCWYTIDRWSYWRRHETWSDTSENKGPEYRWEWGTWTWGKWFCLCHTVSLMFRSCLFGSE